jgi:hypothetical protein
MNDLERLSCSIVDLMRAADTTLSTIAEQLNAEGVPTLPGRKKRWPASMQAALGYRPSGPRDHVPPPLPRAGSSGSYPPWSSARTASTTGRPAAHDILNPYAAHREDVPLEGARSRRCVAPARTPGGE